jgi:hypothetical protein
MLECYTKSRYYLRLSLTAPVKTKSMLHCKDDGRKKECRGTNDAALGEGSLDLEDEGGAMRI